MSSKRLYKSKNKLLSGVCGGIAEYLNIDPTIVRIVWAILSLYWCTGLIAYIIAAVIMPESP